MADQSGGVLVWERKPFAPGAERTVELLDAPVSIRSALELHEIDPSARPTLVMVNGEAVLRVHWDEIIIDQHDVMVVVSLPEGGNGGGASILRAVLMIVIMIVAWYVAPALVAAYGGSAGMWAAGIQIVGGMLVNALVPAPKATTPDVTGSIASPSPTYSLQAQSNAARLGQPIPVIYGRVCVYPDYAALPYADFSSNDQYLYQLFCIGQGDYSIEAVRIEDQPLVASQDATTGYWNSSSPFTDISWEIVPPGASVTLFPTRVLTSALVSGQELLTDLGPFQLSDAEQNAAAFDVVLPSGLYYANDSGGTDSRSITVECWAQLLVQSGASWVASGSWVKLGTETITLNTTTPQRQSFHYTLPATGRYQYKMVRTTAKDTSSRAANTIDWAGLRGYVPGAQSYGEVTLIAMRMKATDQLSQQSARKVNVVCTRKLPTWSPTSGWSTTKVPTRSIAWAYLDACRDSNYGLGLPDSALPIAEVYAYEHSTWQESTRDAFDYIFDRQLTAWPALSMIVRAGRAITFQQGPRLRVVRDEPASVPVQMFSMRNIVRGSFSLKFVMQTSDTTDSAEVTYWDETIWSQSTVECVPSGITASNPSKLQLDGVQRRDQAWREGCYASRQNAYRRQFATFTTEMEGLIATPGDLVAVQHDMPQWGAGSELVSFTGTGTTSGDSLTLADDLTFVAGATHYVGLRRSNGSMSGPWRVAAGADARTVVLQEAVTDAAYEPQIGYDRERTHVVFGPATAFVAMCRVIPPIRPRNGQVEVNVVLEDARVHDDSGTTPTLNNPYLLTNLTAPTLRGLGAVFSGSLDSPSLDLSWEVAAGASSYNVEISTDGQSYVRVGEPTTNALRIQVPLRQVWVRVAAVGSLRGPWVVWTGNPATMISIPADVTGLTGAFSGPDVACKWSAAARADYYRIEIWSGATKVATYTRTETYFSYPYSANRADSGPRRSFDMRVYAVNGAGDSTNFASVSVSNPQISTISVTASDIGAAMRIVTDTPTSADYAGTVYKISQTHGFDPTATSPAPIYDGPATIINTDKLAAGTWYVRAAHYDSFGEDGLSWSPEVSVVVSPIASGVPRVADASTITAAPGTATPPGGDAQIAVWSNASNSLWTWNAATGHYLNNADLANASYNLLTANRSIFGTLSALSASLGNITSGNITLDTAGFIRGGASSYSVGAGLFLGYSGSAYVFRVGAAPGAGASICWDGSAWTLYGADGSVVMSAGSGMPWSKIASKPANVAALSGTEAIQNSAIAISGGALVGIGAGAGTQVDNSYAPIGQNCIANSDQTSAMTWEINWNPDSVPVALAPQYASLAFGSPNQYALDGPTRGVVAVQGAPGTGSTGGTGDNEIGFYLVPSGFGRDYGMSVVTGDRVCASVYIQCHRCKVSVGVVYFDATGAQVWAAGSLSAPVGPISGNANSLTVMTRINVITPAPANAVSVCLYVCKFNTMAGQTDSYIWVAAPQLEKLSASATGPSPYQPGPISTTRQLGYTGDLNATYGAHAGTNLYDSAGNSLTDGLVRNDQQPWAWVTGAGKPADNATVGAAIGVNLTGAWAQATWDAAMPGAFIRSAHIAGLTVDKLLAALLAVGQYIGSTSYSAGSSGWMIRADGTAEFRNVIARGDIEATTLNAGSANIVQTIHLAGETVTVPRVISGAGPFSSGATLFTVPADMQGSGAAVFIVAGRARMNVNSSGNGTSVHTFSLQRNGTNLDSKQVTMFEASSGSYYDSFCVILVDSSPVSGSVSYTVSYSTSVSGGALTPQCESITTYMHGAKK